MRYIINDIWGGWMNTANKLTLLRIILIPIFFILLMIQTQAYQIAAAVVFAVAAFTDFLDGHIARTKNQVTTFGKFVDPVADKLLITAAIIGFVEVIDLPSWIAFVIIAREFTVTGLRLVAVSQGRVIAAGNSGKIKTVVQIVVVLFCLFFGQGPLLWNIPLSTWLMGIAAVVTVYSGAEYVVKNWDMIEMK